ADNNRLISNIADFLVGARRTYGLTDFPHFFGDEVGIVPLIDTQDPQAVSAKAIGQLAQLKSAFEATGRVGKLWADEPGTDVIYMGLYGSVEFWPAVAEILATEGISFTLETVELQRATPTPTPPATARQSPTPTPTPTRAKDAPTPTPTPTPEPLKDWIRFDGAGPVEAKEVALFYQNEQGSRQVMIVLAFTEAGLREAAQRLVGNDFTGCLVQEDRQGDPKQASVILCPTTYDASELESTPTPTVEIEEETTPTVEPTAEPASGSILIVSDDDGEGVYEWWTSAYAFDGYAQELGYATTIWSTSYDGVVTLELMQEHDAVIWCTGDYQDGDLNPEEADLSILVEYLLDGGRVLLEGAFIGSPEDAESGLLIDVQVVQSDHPLAAGFVLDEVIVLERFTADQDYAPFVLDEGTDEESVVFVRGPGSEFAGRPLITLDEGSDEEGRSMLIGFPIYLLPYDAQERLANNILAWLMAGD
ncbi:MAG: hypothetical protein JW934_04345, partial [Anaerolineae bacterium]|nr:hypothetical protein [Anaerolineae bacterium]